MMPVDWSHDDMFDHMISHYTYSYTHAVHYTATHMYDVYIIYAKALNAY